MANDKKQIVKLNESQLTSIIMESVRQYLKEAKEAGISAEKQAEDPRAGWQNAAWEAKEAIANKEFERAAAACERASQLYNEYMRNANPDAPFKDQWYGTFRPKIDRNEKGQITDADIEVLANAGKNSDLDDFLVNSRRDVKIKDDKGKERKKNMYFMKAQPEEDKI